MHPLVLLVWSLAIATAAIFAWLTASNLVSLRRFDDPALRLYAAFTAAGALDATLVAASFLPMSSAAKVMVFQLLWASGSLAVALWMRAVARFVGAGDERVIRWLSRVVFGVVTVVLADVVWTRVSGTSLMFELGPRGSRSILIHASGDVFRHRPLADLISVVAILGVFVGSLSLLWIVRRERPGERLVQLGIVLTAAFGVTQAALAGTDSPYTAPLLFMANLVEAMRITWVSRSRIGEELEAVRRKQEEQSILIDHQLEQLQLTDRMAKLGENTAEVTHDLRNPLGAVLAGVELAELELAEPEPDHAQLAESLALARASVEHSLTLVRRITNQARTSDPDPVQPQPLHLRAILDDALSLCRQQSEGVQVEFEIPAELSVLGRPTELIQVFVNLLSNACDAIQDREVRRIWVRARGSSDRIEIEVEDAGPRPPELIVARMFKERFTTRPEGTGLGLSICARIVRRHHGTIAVDPRAEHTTIHISLPAAPQNN